jgi:hypothetical protein
MARNSSHLRTSIHIFRYYQTLILLLGLYHPLGATRIRGRPEFLDYRNVTFSSRHGPYASFGMELCHVIATDFDRTYLFHL